MTNPDMGSGNGLTVERHAPRGERLTHLVGDALSATTFDAWLALLEHATEGEAREGVVAVRWQLEPGAVVPPHSHAPAVVVSLCLEGECRVRHFDFEGKPPAPARRGRFRLRETHDRLLRPGVATSLTPTRDNVHSFEAGPQGARGIDITMPLPGADARDWSGIELGEPIGSDFDRVFCARWVGKDLIVSASGAGGSRGRDGGPPFGY